MSDAAHIVDSLPRDLAAWQQATLDPPLNRHASQVAGLVEQLTAALDELAPLLAGDPVSAELEQSILDYHHIWDFFRTKLALRYVPWYQPLLGAADDLAWAAFRPVRDAARRHADLELREPPLVFLSRTAAPFTVTRGDDYRDLLPRGGIWTERADQVATNLVVPVVSLPWHRTTWLPVVLSVAHEVGHVVVSDLDLLPTLQQSLAQAQLPEAHRPAWASWLEEVFADTFAAVVCGSATALSLADQVGTESTVLAGENEPPAGWGDYPPVELRVRLILQVARRRGELGDQPTPPLRPHRLAAFDADVQAVVAALLDHAWPQLGGRLTDLFSPVDGAALRDDINRLSRGRLSEATDVRAVLAAATCVAATAPGDYADHAVHDAALARATQIRDVGRRSRRPVEWSRTAERNRVAGQELAGLLMGRSRD